MILLIQTWKPLCFDMVDSDRETVAAENLLECLQQFFWMHYLNRI